jgi:phosphoketolase
MLITWLWIVCKARVVHVINPKTLTCNMHHAHKLTSSKYTSTFKNNVQMCVINKHSRGHNTLMLMPHNTDTKQQHMHIASDASVHIQTTPVLGSAAVHILNENHVKETPHIFSINALHTSTKHNSGEFWRTGEFCSRRLLVLATH